MVRSDQPVTGTQWPHDKLIAVSEPYEFVFLLFVLHGRGADIAELPVNDPAAAKVT